MPKESLFRADPVRKAGARGPLQIIPRYFCPTADGELAPHKRAGRLEGCDLIVDGVKAVKWFWVTYDNDWSAALCHYNSGEKCFARSRGYAKRVVRRWRRLERQLNALLAAEAER